jgi:hypothetical protein
LSIHIILCKKTTTILLIVVFLFSAGRSLLKKKLTTNYTNLHKLIKRLNLIPQIFKNNNLKFVLILIFLIKKICENLPNLRANFFTQIWQIFADKCLKYFLKSISANKS